MIIFLFGEDGYRIKKNLSELKQQFASKVPGGELNIIEIDGTKTKAENISSLCSPQALFSQKRLLIIKDFFSNNSVSIFTDVHELLKKFIDSGNQNSIIFIDAISEKAKLQKEKALLFKFLAGQKYSHCFNPLSARETAQWISKYVQDSNCVIHPDAVRELASNAPGDLWKLENELNKLISLKTGTIPAGGIKPLIDLKDLDLIYSADSNLDIFALTDALSNRDKKSALRFFEERLINDGSEGAYITSMFSRQIKIILKIRQALDLGKSSRTIVSELKLHPFVAQKGILQARNFTLDKLKSIFSELVKIDSEIKSGRKTFALAISEFIVNY